MCGFEFEPVDLNLNPPPHLDKVEADDGRSKSLETGHEMGGSGRGKGSRSINCVVFISQVYVHTVQNLQHNYT